MEDRLSPRAIASATASGSSVSVYRPRRFLPPLGSTADSVSRLPRWAAPALTIAVLGIAIVAAAADQGGSGLALAVESLSGRSSDALQRVGGGIPAAYAFVAGMIAAVNPCGFAMLPGYLALYLGDRPDGHRPLGRALAISGSVAASFVVLFGAIGLLLTVTGGLLTRFLPVASLLVGAL